MQKFGTQASVARKIHVFQNGDKNHKGVVVTLVKGLANMNKVLGEITNKLTLTTGAAQRIYRVVGAGESFTQVTELAAFEDGGIYLACGAEKIDKVKRTGAPQPPPHPHTSPRRSLRSHSFVMFDVLGYAVPTALVGSPQA